jgi:hypothetical protein
MKCKHVVPDYEFCIASGCEDYHTDRCIHD